MPIWIFAAPFLVASEIAATTIAVTGLYLATLMAAGYSAVVPSRPQRVDGFLATEEYALENGLERRRHGGI